MVERDRVTHYSSFKIHHITCTFKNDKSLKDNFDYYHDLVLNHFTQALNFKIDLDKLVKLQNFVKDK